ncbi:MAG: hypothetical protein K8E66_01565 [Phycisphaerales bacterium]|nr:hypothetical protein [Phycisphaerales bacterium]
MLRSAIEPTPSYRFYEPVASQSSGLTGAITTSAGFAPESLIDRDYVVPLEDVGHDREGITLRRRTSDRAEAEKSFDGVLFAGRSEFVTQPAAI